MLTGLSGAGTVVPFWYPVTTRKLPKDWFDWGWCSVYSFNRSSSRFMGRLPTCEQSAAGIVV
jgi:hypothetical protein